MSYKVLARKYRPQLFEEIVGQKHITTTLSNAIRAGRISHAYLFAGPRGTGKTTAARILAKAVNCQSGPTPTPCNTCPNCLSIIEGRCVDVMEIDGASNNSVDEVRTLRDNVAYAPANSRWKIYIIDEVHMLSNSAFNALLKTLEEPPDSVMFILATTEVHKIPTTILSRCQRFDFRRIPAGDIVGMLRDISSKEGIKAEDEALRLIARASEGCMRDAISLLDQAIAYGGGNVTLGNIREILGAVGQESTLRAIEAILKGDAPSALSVVDEVFREGWSLTEFNRSIADHLRNLLVMKVGGGDDLIDLPQSTVEALRDFANSVSADDVLRMLKVSLGFVDEVARSEMPRTVVEMMVVKLANMESTVRLSEILERLRLLHEPGSGGAVNGGDETRSEREDLTEENGAAAEGNGEDSILKTLAESLRNDGKITLCLSLKECKLLRERDDTFVIMTSNSVVKNQIEDKRKEIESRLQLITGKRQRLKVVSEASLSPFPKKPSDKFSSVVEEEPIIKFVLDEYKDSSIIDVRE